MTQDKLDIKHQVVLNAGRDSVWRALTTAEGWTAWFSNSVHGKFEEGEVLAHDFGDDTVCYAKVVERTEKVAFAYRWHPGEDCPIDKYPDLEMTTVRFTLADHPNGTLLTMVESGFENIPETRRANCVTMNTDGWAWELTEFRAAVEFGDRQLVDSGEIVRERTFSTTPEALWELVATPEGMKRWWVKDVLGGFSEGHFATLVFEMPDGKLISGPLKVLKYRRPEVLSFMSHPGEIDGCTWDKYPESEATTTTFTISPEGAKAKLRVVESGFSNIPKSRRFNAIYGNAEGWSIVMSMIEKAID